MAKMKITTLTDKAGDDEILRKLKGLGVKIKDKNKEEAPHDDIRETPPPAGETVTEKKIAPGVIRRRASAPTKPEPAPSATFSEVSDTIPAQPLTGEKRDEGTRRTVTVTEKPFHVELQARRPDETQPPPSEEVTEIQTETAPPPHDHDQPRIVMEEIPAKEPASGAEEREPEPGHPEEIHAESGEVKPEAPQKEEAPKHELEGLGEAKEKEITKVLEEAYKQDLDKGVELGEDEEETKKKKAEKLLRRIDEQEQEEVKTKKKGVLKRKVVIKQEDLYAFRRQRGKQALQRKGKGRGDDGRHEEDKKQEAKAPRKVLKVGNDVILSDLAKKMGIKAQEIIMKLLSMGTMASINKSLDFDTAFLVASEFGFELEKTLSIEEEFQAREDEQKDSIENLKPRSPVVTIMGHVDHGKTLLLDTIRHTNVAEREAGGITQHIGAYKVMVDGKEIVFIDTPGHEAFTSMRARGALVTDIVILVVAADDGVMPQTIEAINHAKSAKVPIIVAVNKIDKSNANTDKVTKDLSEYGLIPEDWGGTTLFARISAKKKVGIQELLELIVLQAEMLELTANPDKLAKGIIIESRLDKGHGPVGTVIIQEGTLKIHDPFIAGSMFGRVRAMIDDRGKRVLQAPPSTPVVVVGFQEVPNGGDAFIVTTEERYARELSKFRQEKLKEKEIARSARTTLEDLYSKMGGSEKTSLNVIIKGDVRGTIDAIVEAMKRLSNDKVEIQIIHSGVGAITETDVNLALATGSIIVGFNVKPIGKAQAMADQEKIEIRSYAVIYEMIDDVKKAMEGLLAPTIKETPVGKGEVRQVFTVSKIGTIAGSYITEGKATRNSLVRVLRNNDVLFTGKLSSLKRFKDDVREVLSGYECGIGLDGFNDLKEGDLFEFFIEEKETQTLDG